MKEKIKIDNQQQNILKNKTGWKRHFTGKNIIINGLIALLPTSLIIGILRELVHGEVSKLSLNLSSGDMATASSIVGFVLAILFVSIIFGFIYLTGIIREKISKSKNKWTIIAIIVALVIILIAMCI